MRITKDVARIVETTTTPTGEPGILVECTCGLHPTGTRAILRACAPTPALIHGNVNTAWHPWAGIESIQRFGPWQA